MATKIKNLVIVESPSKASTIEKYLGADYKVAATVGHIRDLPKRKLGVDVEHGFEPEYVIPKDKAKIVSGLKGLAKGATTVYLATDGDREGEAIAWHVLAAADIDPAKTKRLKFYEITKPAILQALEHPQILDERLVHAQQARRILDRLVGYKISPLLGKRLSAGRVQSVALKMIIDRERERNAFKPLRYFAISALLAKGKDQFTAELARAGERKIGRLDLTDPSEAERIKKEIESTAIAVESVEFKETRRNPAPPFITSSLQREAANKFGMAPGRTMRAAQRLYEGIELAGQHVGLITYMRTDSLHMAESAVAAMRSVIAEKFGEQMLSAEPRRYKKKVKGAQEAHEAIRPTDAAMTPERLKAYVKGDELKIYKLIWERALATQMAEAKVEHMIVTLTAGPNALEARGERIVFAGFIAVYLDSSDTEAIGENLLPALTAGDKLETVNVDSIEKFTEPPARYSAATLIKALEDNGIGRPSTYAMILDKIVYERAYVAVESGRLVPQLLGFAVNDYLEKNFADIVDTKFTARMEGELDEIAEGTAVWREILKGFYGPFSAEVARSEYMKPTITDIPCNRCDSLHMELKTGPFGPYLLCDKCGFKTSYPPKVPLSGVICPRCGKSIYERKSKKRGRIFYGCGGFPECRFASWDKPTADKCPRCGNMLYEKGKKLVCKHEGCGYEAELPVNKETALKL